MKKFISIILLTGLIFSQTTLIAKADPDKMFAQVTGMFTAAFFGPFIAMPRGALKGAVLGTKKAAKVFGNEDGRPQLIAGAFTGGFTGGAAGMFTALLKAERDAFKHGYADPWSDESFSLGGQEILDYDPFYWGEFDH